ALLTATLLTIANLIAPSALGSPARHVPERLLVKPKHGTSETALQYTLGLHGAKQLDVIPQIDLRIVHVPEQLLERALDSLRHNPNVEFAEPDYILAPCTFPNDPYYSAQWYLTKIAAPTAWTNTTGSTNVIIAILDSGVDGSHPDLAPQMVPGWN